MLNSSVTANTHPSFANNILIDIRGECTFTIMSFRNPLSSIIVFGHNLLSIETNLSNDSILASVQYELKGEILLKILLHHIQFQLTNKCNNGTTLKPILKSIQIEEDFNSLIVSNPSFNS